MEIGNPSQKSFDIDSFLKTGDALKNDKNSKPAPLTHGSRRSSTNSRTKNHPTNIPNDRRNLPALPVKEEWQPVDKTSEQIIAKPPKPTISNLSSKRTVAPLPLSHLHTQINRPSSEMSHRKLGQGGVLKVVALQPQDTTSQLASRSNASNPATQRSARSTSSSGSHIRAPRVLDFSLESKQESGKYTPMGEMFPNRVDKKGKRIKFEKEDDLKLTYIEIKKDMKAIKRELTKDETEDKKQKDKKKRRSVPLELNTPEALAKRLRRLLYYRKVISRNLLVWNEYRTERDNFVLEKSTTLDEDYNVVSVHGHDIEIEIQRFDDEFRRVKLRANQTLTPLAKKAIEKVDPAAAAESMVDRMMERIKERGDDESKVDRAMEKEKLTEEIIRWKNRWMEKGDVPVAPNSDSEDDEDIFFDDDEDLSVSSVHDDEEEDDFDLEDGIEVIIVNDVGHMTNENDGFFLTITDLTTEPEESDDEKDEKDRKTAIRQLRRLSDTSSLGNTPSPTSRLTKSPRSGYSSPSTRMSPRKGSPTVLAPLKRTPLVLPEVRSSSGSTSRTITPTIDWTVESRLRIDPSMDIDGDDSVMLDDDESPVLDENVEFDDSFVSSLDFSPSNKKWGKSPRGLSPIEPPKEKPQKRKQAQVTQLLQHLKDELEYSEQVKQIKRDQQKKKDPDDDDDDEDEDDDEEDRPNPTIENGKFSPRLTKKRTEEDEEERKRKKRMKRLVVELDHVLGTGGHGKVYRGQITDTDEVVAIKKIPIKAGKFSKKFVKLEIDILRKLAHPNLVRYMGCKFSSKFREYSIVLEYVDGGSLEQIIKKRGPLSENQVAGLVHQILQGLSHLHSKRVIHRDLKPGNILVTRSGQVKITDFGVSAQLLNIESMRSSCVGTPYYSAPEVIQVVPYSYQADIWSLGCAIYEMLFGVRPYHELNQVAAMYRMVKDGHPPVPTTNAFGQDCLNFLHACWVVDWKERPTADELSHHPFVKGRNSEELVMTVFN